MSAPSALLAAALAYAARGWPVVACHHPTIDGPCSCGRAGCEDQGKHPHYHRHDLPYGLHSATTDPYTIQHWWTRWPNANIAIATGPGAGLLVADSDHPTLYQLPSTAIVATARGLHAYFAYPDIPLQRSTRTGLLPHLDTRGAGGMVIAPPSRHRSGQSYTWLTAGPLTPVLSWLLTLLLAPPPTTPRGKKVPLQSRAPHPAQTIHDKIAYGAAALAAELTTLRAAPVGQRNRTLNWVAFRSARVGTHAKTCTTLRTPPPSPCRNRAPPSGNTLVSRWCIQTRWRLIALNEPGVLRVFRGQQWMLHRERWTVHW